MQEQEILDGNKLIEEFMGNTVYKIRNIYFVKTSEEGSIRLEHCKHHSSWDWLMPVVKQIGTIKVNGIELGTEITGSKDLYGFVVFGTHIYTEDTTMQEAVWKGVVKFIKWYNKYNKNK